VLTTTVRIYRENWRRVVGAAFVVFGAIAILDTAEDALNDRLNDPVVALILLAASVLGVFGATFYSGLLDRLVGAAEYGGRRHSVGEVLRTLPYVRLMAAAALLLALTAIGTLLLIVPGLIVFTLFSLVGPLINIENHGVRGAFRRSAHLVRPRFWLVLALVTLPIIIEDDVVSSVEAAIHGQHLLWVFLTMGITGAAVGSVVGLIEVVLAYELVARDRAAARGSDIGDD
jgi:hypothetical protein